MEIARKNATKALIEEIIVKSEQEKLALRDEIVKWQMKFYNSSEVSLELFRNFLEKY